MKIILVWLLAATICSPMFVLGVLNPQNVYFKRVCAPNHSNFKLYGSIFAFYIPLFIIIIAYAFTLQSLKKLINSKNSTSRENTINNPHEALVTASINESIQSPKKNMNNVKSGDNSVNSVRNKQPIHKPREMIVEEKFEGELKPNAKTNSVDCSDCKSKCLNCVRAKKSENEKVKAYNCKNLLTNNDILSEFQLEQVSKNNKYKKRISFNLSSNANESIEENNKSEPEENPSQQISPLSLDVHLGNKFQFMIENRTKSFPNNSTNPIRKNSFLSTVPNDLANARNHCDNLLSQQLNFNNPNLIKRKKHSIFSQTENWSNHSNIRISKARNERKALKVLIIIFIVFVCLWSPFFLFNTLSAFCKSDKCFFLTQNMLMPITWLGYISSMVNPIVYTMFSNNFRKAVFNLLKCKTVNPNLQRSIFLAYRSKSFCDSRF